MVVPRGSLPDDKSIVAHIGRRLAEARRASGLSARAVAAESGVTPERLRKAEEGRRGLGAGDLFRVAQALGLEVADLYRGLPETVAGAVFDPLATREGRDLLQAALHLEKADPGTFRSACELVRALADEARDGQE